MKTVRGLLFALMALKKIATFAAVVYNKGEAVKQLKGSGAIRQADGEVFSMMYPFMTLNDKTEIVHSEMKEDGRVKVYMERPDEALGFKHATCYLPSYTWEDIVGFTQAEVDRFQEVIESTAHLIMRFAQDGGVEHAANF